MSVNDHPNILSEKVASYLNAVQVENLPEDLVPCMDTEHFKSALNRYDDHLEGCMKNLADVHVCSSVQHAQHAK